MGGRCYFISKPIENVGWDFYQEFLPAARRADGIDGKYAASTGVAVPTCMGDYYRSFRVVGTNTDFFGRLTRGDGEPFRFTSGENFRDADFFAGVIGATVAETLGLKVGDPFSPTHGADDGKVHDPFKVVGILERTWTPIDRGVFVNMEGFYLQDGHAKPLPDGVEPAAPQPPAGDGPARLPAAQREVTAILLETASLPGLPPELTAMGLRTAINEGGEAQAALPVAEIRQLLDLFVRPLELVLLLVTGLVVLVSALGILISMVGSSLERSRDVAIMRALGARRGHVLATVLIEAVLLAVGGGTRRLGARACHRGRDRPLDRRQCGGSGRVFLLGPRGGGPPRPVSRPPGDRGGPAARPGRLPDRRLAVAPRARLNHSARPPGRGCGRRPAGIGVGTEKVDFPRC